MMITVPVFQAAMDIALQLSAWPHPPFSMVGLDPTTQTLQNAICHKLMFIFLRARGMERFALA
jgi:hypothetical protein